MRNQHLLKEFIVSPKTAIWVCFALAFIFLPIQAKGNELLKLKHHVEVSADLVTLGDLFHNIRRYRNEPVFRSPTLGKEGTISLNRIIDVAERYNLIFDIPINQRHITITRPSRSIKPQTIETFLKNQVRAINNTFAKGNLLIEYDQPLQDFKIPVHYSGDLKFSTFKYDKFTNHFVAIITPIEDNRSNYALSIKASVSQSFLRPVLTRTINQGETIQPSDIAMKTYAKRRIPKGAIKISNKIIGMSANKTLRTGSFIKPQDISTPKLIKKNQLVTVLLQMPGMTLKTQGKAIDEGAKNDTISVMNLHSKRIIQGTVTGPGIIIVQASSSNFHHQKTAHLNHK